MQAAEFVVATPSSACHVSLVHPAPLEGQKPRRSVWGPEYPYQSVNTSQLASDPGENFRVLPMLHPVLMLAYTSPSSLLLVSSLLFHNQLVAIVCRARHKLAVHLNICPRLCCSYKCLGALIVCSRLAAFLRHLVACSSLSSALHFSSRAPCVRVLQVDKPWEEVYKSLPEPLYRHQYGT